MKYFIILYFSFLLNGCGLSCFEYKGVGSDDPEPDLFKKFTIVNRTDKTYTNNTLFSLNAEFDKEEWQWKFEYCSNYDLHVQKLNIIKPEETINKNEKGKIIELDKINYSSSGKLLFLFSLDGGKRKVFFGDYGRWPYGVVRETDESNCTKYFLRYDVHPVWQEKDLTITIEKDGKIKFSDPKIKEVKKLKLPKQSKKLIPYEEVYVDPNTLPLVDCSKE